MRNKFLKMTFMALCLSTSSALHAMNEDELENYSSSIATSSGPATSSSSATSPYVGKYEIRRNDPYEQPSGSVTIRQEGDFLVLENFSLIAGSHYHDRVVEVASEQEERNPNFTSPFNTDSRRIADFVLSALPTEVLQLKCLKSNEKEAQYVGVTSYGELHEIWANIKDKTPHLGVRFHREKNSYFGEMFTLFVETPFAVSAASPIEAFRLFKVGSAEHERLLRPLFAPAAGVTPAAELVSASSSADSMYSVKTTFRTTGTNPNARNKHSAISIQLPNQQLQDDMYTLVINHRTSVKGSQVRTYAPKHGKLNILGDLPLSATFSDTSFNITPWVQSIREEGSLMTNIAAYLTFVDGQSDIHSFTIQPKESSLMTVILGDKDSEALPGIHVYGPETDGDANDWSGSRSDA